MKIWLIFYTLPILLLTILSCATATHLTGARKPQAEPEFSIDTLAYQTNVALVNTVNLRTGIFAETNSATFKGCVLYLEGLADSMLNHRPYFKSLSEQGYRIVAFDYIGQGGSSGTMNHSRIYDPLFSSLEIGSQAKFVWNHYAECANSKKIVIGWSTGGLAAYRLAHEEWADAVVLIAPGIHPNKLVGEAAVHPTMLLTGEQVITKRTLTRNSFEGQNDPHVDAIKPISPTLVPLFATNLVGSATISQSWQIKGHVKGLVFLSGANDTYVDRENTLKTLKSQAPHFVIHSYEGALHELDNELPAVSQDLYVRTIRFFESL